jgi:hypothetical protein
MSSLNLLSGDGGLFWTQEAGMGLALHRTGETEIGAMTGLGIFGTGAARFAALDSALR